MAKQQTAGWWLTPLLGGVSGLIAVCQSSAIIALPTTALSDTERSDTELSDTELSVASQAVGESWSDTSPAAVDQSGAVANRLTFAPSLFDLVEQSSPPPLSTGFDQSPGLWIVGDPRVGDFLGTTPADRRSGRVFSETLFHPAPTTAWTPNFVSRGDTLLPPPIVATTNTIGRIRVPAMAASSGAAGILPADIAAGASGQNVPSDTPEVASVVPPAAEAADHLAIGHPRDADAHAAADWGAANWGAANWGAGDPLTTAEPNPGPAPPMLPWSSDELPEWWAAKVADLQRSQATVRSVGLSDLINQAITQSPKIRMLQRLPALADTQIQRERGEFDPRLRLDTQYRSDRDPVGNQLQTGGPPVLQDNAWTANAGVQRRFANGTTADLYQRLGFKNSNSLFFSPQDQGTATVGLDVTHPLWRNSGREFNQSLIVIAELQGQVSFFEYQAELQKEMIEIGNLYWQLLNAREIALQVARSRDRAEEILAILTARTDYDTSANQVSLAKAEVSQRQTEWLDAQQRLRDLEIILRDKINDPHFTSVEDIELIPAEFFADVFAEESITLGDALEQALTTRWELQREERLTRVADRQLFISRCGLAPKLDLVLGVYSSGLAGDSGVEQAWANQFGAATPGFYGGFDYEVPFGRRQAKADVQRNQLQKQQALDAYQVVQNEVVAQVRTAHSRVDTAIRSRQAAYQTVLDMRDALTHLQRRWEATALVDGGAVAGMAPSIALEQLLAAQRRLQDAEQRLVNADLQWALSRQALMLAMGQVLQSQLPTAATAETSAPAAVQ